MGGQPIPKVAALSQEYEKLLAEKQKEYERYKAARQDMITYQSAKHNVDQILGIRSAERGQEKENPQR